MDSMGYFCCLKVLSNKSSFLFVGPDVEVTRVHMTTAYEYDLNQTAERKSCNFHT